MISMKRLAAVLLSFAVAIPVFGRVLSYAPYTNQPARVGVHERSTRYFVTIEGRTTYFSTVNEVVLYDSSGVEEPKVVYPPSGATHISQVALFEKSDPAAKPMLLVAEGPKTMFSADGGATWSWVSPIINDWTNGPRDVDVGGPFVQGLGNQILPGNEAWPFVVAYSSGVRAISAKGESKLLFPAASLVGRNAAGDRFLINSLGQIRTLDFEGNSALLSPSDPAAAYMGWITSDGSAYLEALRAEGRFLYFHRNGETKFVLGPYDVAAPIGAPIQTFDTMRFFAIPTADYNGAWMIQRQAGRPTTLSRHTPSRGIETIWSDVSGPEVEALIAGASGETLLVQVHRRRDDLTPDRLFVDPALAVWRVGEPAPRQYHELYLRENWNKGFVHVDVDRVAGGDPFVFNSGVMEDPIEIIVSPQPGGGGDVMQEWGVVRGSFRQRLALPGVARLHGAFDSYWLTDVTIHNPSDASQNVAVQFVALGEAVHALAARKTTLSLAPGEIRVIPDALNVLFDIENGGGALYFEPDSAISVTSRTYSRTSAGGTYGFGMQAIDFFNAAGPRFPMTFAGAFPGEHFRTNLLLTDTSGRGTSVQVNASGVSGRMGATDIEVVAPSGGVAQYNGLRGPLGLLSRDDGGLHIEPTRGTVIPTLVAIDNRTNDPTYFPPDLPSFEARTIPVIGHIDGANGSHFRSDLYLLNPTAEIRTVSIEAKQWDSPLRKMVQFTMLPREARIVPDALPTLFGMTGLARVRYQSQVGVEGVRITSRTYTLDASGATYGCLIPPLNNFQRAVPGDTLEILGVNGGGNFRANLGIVELSPSGSLGATTVRITILDGMSKTLDSFTVSLQSSNGMQINDIFGSRGLTQPAAAMILVQVVDGGVIGAYATLTDNVTNDSTYLATQLGAQPN
jgi:hypothetical protein